VVLVRRFLKELDAGLAQGHSDFNAFLFEKPAPPAEAGSL